MVVLMAQQGAGKTRVAELIGRRLDELGGFVELDSDLFKPYHPAYARLMAEDDRAMTQHTAADGRAWMRQAQEYVRTEGMNALMQTTAGNPEYLAESLRADRAAGMRVEVAALAVAEPLSEQGYLNRYHEQVKERGSGRLTVPEKAAAAYQAIPEAAALIESERLADYAAVYRRGESTPRWANALDEQREWLHPGGFATAIKEERARPLSAQEAADFTAVQSKLRAEMGSEFRSQLERVDARAAQLLPHGGNRIPAPTRRQSAEALAAANARSVTAGPPTGRAGSPDADTRPRTDLPGRRPGRQR
ncbi:zeta toxin family protein [Streptomyces sp. GKU 257-1]|nr:zeta toxin family protein [Streptomyces sp. GKU 257-1]